MIKSIMQNRLFSLLIAVVFVAAIFFHFLFLDRVPAGMSHDEVVYSLSSEMLFLNGTDITGTHLPIGFFQTPTEGNISLLPPLILSPLHFLLPVNQATARIPYVIFIFLGSIAVFLIAESLFGDRKIAFLGMSFFLFEPWSFFLARFATEPPIALMFYLWAIALVLRLRGWKLLIPFFVFVLAFYSYHGGKIIFLPLVIAILIYLWFDKKISKKSAVIFFLGSLTVFVSFFVISFSLPLSIVTDRQNEIFFLNRNFINQQVNSLRPLSLQNSFTTFFVNKVTVGILIFIQKYINAFSVQLLFLQGDPRIIYAFFYHGLLFFFDALFIPVGFVYLFIKKRTVGWFVTCLILISPIPSALNAIDNSYINRSELLLPVFTMLSGLGLFISYEYISKKITKIGSILILSAFVLSFVANFLFFYFYEYPYVTGDYYSIGEKVASEFIKLSWDGKKQLVVVTQEPGELYLETAFFFQNKKIINSFITNIPMFNKGVYKLSNVVFTGDCPTSNNSDTVYLVQDLRTCPILSNPQNYIKNPKEENVIYSIYNNNICKNISSSPWILHNSNDYSMENMNVKEFCQKWISS